MDSQGAGFAFDMNMDFSNMFATKPVEGSTSNGFFFGDEGIDAATTSFGSDFDMMNPALLTAAPQEQSFISQDLSLDNTMASASMWTGQLTPQSQPALNSFPPTPVQSLETMFEQPTTTLGKRALQLDVEDFPQAKRHEAIDYSTMFSPSSSWTLDTQMTPPSTVAFGLSDEAADMCAMWFNKYAILPSDRHIHSLSQLTGESADAIRNWFGRLLKQGMGSSHGDSAYKSQTALAQQEQFWNDISTDMMQVPQLGSAESTQEAIIPAEVPCAADTVTAVQPANALRGGKKQRCSPTDDRSLLSRDPNKIYQCTRKCGKRYGRKCDWKRNEEEGYPCKSWVCSLCVSLGVDNVKACFRKYHFAQHFRNIHPGMNCEDYEETSIVCSETEFPRQCGFCKHRFETRQERIDHIADHFKQGKCMLEWSDEGGDSGGSDDSDNDNDDGPNDDGNDSDRSSFQPPGNAPHGGSNTKYNGGSNNGGGAGGGGSGGGFFQFHISQFAQRGTEDQTSYTDKQRIISGEDISHSQRHLRASSEPLQQCSTNFYNGLEPDYRRPRPDTTAKCDSRTLAGDALSLSLTSRDNICTHPPSELEAAQSVINDVVTEDDQDQSLHIVATDGTDKDDTGTLKTLSNIPTLQRDTLQDNSSHTSSSQLLQTIPKNSQSFVSVKLLGSGGFSTVDEVIHRETKLRLGRKTLKNRDPAAIKELLKEVNVLQKLRHPHVIRFLGAYSTGDKMSILVSPVADTTLALWLDQFSLKKPANLTKIITTMFGCLASSVRYLHEQRPVVKHMDIKPQNILVVEGDGEYPHVVLCDFGISSSDEATEEQVQPLTRHYVAPEVFEGAPRKQAADIWSLGCVFTEMASVPFSQDNAGWLKLRQEYNGRKKHYWQDASGLQDKLAVLLEEASTPTEATVVRSIKAMLDPQPAERPDAASLTLVFSPAPCCLSWPNDKATYPGPREELNAMEGFLQGDDKYYSDQQNGHGHTTSTRGNAKEWLDECSHHHEACRQSDLADNQTLPTRLVDISPDDQDQSFVRIVDSAQIDGRRESIKYITLSHAWTNSDVTLNNDSQQAMEAHLPKELLSQPLNSAICTAQDLGYRYIWVDSLCVLQDNEADKHRECAMMASVFRNSAVTVVVDQIEEDIIEAEGDHKLEAHQHSCIDDVRDLEEGRMRAAAILPAHDFTSPGFGWDTRAWALQERLLSHRFLHLGREQMYWECNELKASDTFPQGLSSLIWEKVHSKLDPRDARHPELDANGTNAATFAKTKAVLTETPRSISPHRVRDCQWIRKKGDALGDSMEAAQTNFKVCRNDKPCAHTTTQHGGRRGNITRNMQLRFDEAMARRELSSSAQATSKLATGTGRQQIGDSGQMDQNGSGVGVNGKLCGDVNANGNGMNREENALV